MQSCPTYPPSTLTSLSSLLLTILARQPVDFPPTSISSITSLLSASLKNQLTSNPSLIPYPQIRGLSKLLSAFGSKLPAERTTQTLLKPLILPLLKTSTSSQIKCASIDCLAGVLRFNNYGSSLYGSLIVDVDDNGNEISVTNPLRNGILNGIIKGYKNSVEDLNNSNSDKEITAFTRALTHSIQQLATLNVKLLPKAFQPTTILLPTLNFVLRTRNDNTVYHNLLLLSSLFKSYGKSMVKYWDCFVDKRGTELMRVIEDRQRYVVKDRVLALMNLKSLITLMPVNLWLGGRKTSSSKEEYVQPKNMANLSGRVEEGVKGIFEMACVKENKTFASHSLAAFKAVQSILFSGSACKRKKPLPCIYAASASITSIIQTSETPTYDLRIEEIIDKARDKEKYSQRLIATSLLAKIGRKFPNLLVEMWEGKVKEVVRELLGEEGKKVRSAGIEIIEHILAGLQLKNNANDSTNSPNSPPPPPPPPNQTSTSSSPSPSIISPELSTWLHTCLTSSEESIRKLTASCYIHLNRSDWSYILNDKERNHLKLLCERGDHRVEKKAGVRVNAIKAVGSMCATVFVESLGEGEIEVERVAGFMGRTLLELKEEKNENVKCMLMLSMGNLGQGLEKAGVRIEEEVWGKLCEEAVGGLNASNEKVVASAIRAIGHLYSIFLRVPNFSKAGVMKGLGETMFHDLTSRIILASTSNPTQLMKLLNSKQRFR
ncbi:hypothetical protein TL16_g06277 [Triparma laevis f. inornata]|uniref:Uncharacterized protein n=1 Tax=Triparma laevis f. inornata TaxID=1714386 RepID=A0A9W7AL94_9STRA|nr:hypothetical protein TL16_g06277 [Triparma laevis f. inornata]